MTVKTALVHSDQWARFDYGPEHPLRMERLGLTWRLMEAYGLTALAGSAVRSPEPAEEAALLTFQLPTMMSGGTAVAAARFTSCGGAPSSAGSRTWKRLISCR